MISLLGISTVAASSGGANAFLSAAQWIQAVLLGTVSTSIAVIAVASVGLLMLSGRVNVRRGATVIFGCFILFGAAGVARGLRSMAGAGTESVTDLPPMLTPPTSAIDPSLISSDSSIPIDSYRGASVRR